MSTYIRRHSLIRLRNGNKLLNELPNKPFILFCIYYHVYTTSRIIKYSCTAEWMLILHQLILINTYLRNPLKQNLYYRMIFCNMFLVAAWSVFRYFLCLKAVKKQYCLSKSPSVQLCFKIKKNNVKGELNFWHLFHKNWKKSVSHLRSQETNKNVAELNDFFVCFMRTLKILD